MQKALQLANQVLDKRNPFADDSVDGSCAHASVVALEVRWEVRAHGRLVQAPMHVAGAVLYSDCAQTQAHAQLWGWGVRKHTVSRL